MEGQKITDMRESWDIKQPTTLPSTNLCKCVKRKERGKEATASKHSTFPKHSMPDNPADLPLYFTQSIKDLPKLICFQP